MMTRRNFTNAFLGLTAISYFGLNSVRASAADGGVIPGAIRWDAWYDPVDASASAQHTLSYQQFFKRAPAHCTVDPNYVVNCRGSQQIIDNEIKRAHDAGLKYWAFCWYPKGNSLRDAWETYQKSTIKNLINWCGIISLDFIGNTPGKPDQFREYVSEWVGYMRQENYQKVAAGDKPNRPLLYVLWDDNLFKTYFNSDLGKMRENIDFLRESVRQAGLDPLYIVIMDGVAGAEKAKAVNADAISNYIVGFPNHNKASYSDMDKAARKYWNDLASTHVPIIPIAMVSWDTRGRQEHPVPWMHAQPIPDPTNFYYPPTPDELTTHIRAAVNYVKQYPTVCPSKTILIYSWDECDEGGGMLPTIGDPSGNYLKAVSKAFS
jgi:hypothetical protein